MARFSEEERVEVWDRWQAGDANRLIGRDLGRSAASIRAFVESWGGVRPGVRSRSLRHLSLVEREEISRGVAAGDSLRMVATRLGRARRRSVGNWPVTVAGSGIGFITLIGQRSAEPDVPNHRNSLNIRSCVGWLRRNSPSGGHRNRSSSG